MDKKQIKNLEILLELIENDLLFVDYRTPSVILYSELHISFMDDELKKQRMWYRFLRLIGFVKDDYCYINLMKNVRMFINMMRAANGLEPFSEKEPLLFRVSSLDKQSVLLEGAQIGERLELR